MLKVELSESGNVVAAKGICKAGDIKRVGLIKASMLESGDNGQI